MCIPGMLMDWGLKKEILNLIVLIMNILAKVVRKYVDHLWIHVGSHSV